MLVVSVHNLKKTLLSKLSWARNHYHGCLEMSPESDTLTHSLHRGEEHLNVRECTTCSSAGSLRREGWVDSPTCIASFPDTSILPLSFSFVKLPVLLHTHALVLRMAFAGPSLRWQVSLGWDRCMPSRWIRRVRCKNSRR